MAGQGRKTGTYHTNRSTALADPVGVYFSAADPDLGRFASPAAFDRSLLLNALFQPGILIPDTWFYVSHHIERMLRTSERGESLIEVLIRGGVVIPSFRDPASMNFNDAAFRSAAEVATELYRKYFEGEASAFAERLQEAFYGPDVVWHVWPDESVGVRYATFLERHLQDPPRPPHLAGVRRRDHREKLQGYWLATEGWRKRVITAARESARNDPGAGVRRIDILRALNQELGGLPYENVLSIQDVRPKVLAKDRAAFDLFSRWIFESYQYNQAVMFNAIPNFTKYTPFSGLVPSIALSPTAASFEPTIGLNEYPTIVHDVLIPPDRLLLQMPAIEMLRIRNDYGKTYMQAVDEWFSAPGSEDATERVKTELNRYAASITREATKSYSGGEMWRLRARLSPQSVGVIGGAAAIGALVNDTVDAGLAAVSGQSGVPLVVLSAVATGGIAAGSAAVYRFYTKRSRQRHPVVIRGPIELNLPRTTSSA